MLINLTLAHDIVYNIIALEIVNTIALHVVFFVFILTEFFINLSLLAYAKDFFIPFMFSFSKQYSINKQISIKRLMSNTNLFNLSSLLVEEESSNRQKRSNLPYLKYFKRFNNYDSFYFNDQFTRKKYEFIQLKKKQNRPSDKSKIVQKTNKKQNEQMVFLLQQINILKNIKNNRNLILSKPRFSIMIENKSCKDDSNDEKKNKFLKRRMQQEIDDIIKGNFCEFIENKSEYQIFFSELIKLSNCKLWSYQKLNYLKNKFNECGIESSNKSKNSFDLKLYTKKDKNETKDQKVLQKQISKYHEIEEDYILRKRSQYNSLIPRQSHFKIDRKYY